MKCIIITYINAEHALADVENMMGYYKFNAIESQAGYLVFSGYFSGNLRHFVQKLNTELESVAFDVEDSMFIVYPVLSEQASQAFQISFLKEKATGFYATNIPVNKKTKWPSGSHLV